MPVLYEKEVCVKSFILGCILDVDNYILSDYLPECLSL